MEIFPAIPVAFAFQSVIGIWLLIGCKGRWFIKLAMLIVTGLLGFCIWQSLDSYLGFPKATSIKKLHGKEMVCLWAYVADADNTTGEKGAIYLWVLPAADPGMLKRGPSPDPESIKLPYDRSTHKAAQSFMEKIVSQEGQPVMIKFDGESSGPSGQGDGVGQGAGRSGNTIGSMSIGEGRMYLLPSPKLPPKLQ